MASIIKMIGKPRKDPKTGKPLKPITSYKLRWYYPVPGGKAEEQTVTWREYADIRTLKGIVEARGGRVRKTDPDVLDRSIISGKQTRVDHKPFGLTVPQLLDEFMTQKARDGIKSTSLISYGVRADVIRAYWADEYVSQLIVPLSDEGDMSDKGRALLDHVTKDLGLSPQAVMEFASAMLNYAVKKDYLTKNPLKLIKLPPQDKFEPRFLSQEEFDLLLSHETDPEYRLLLITAWETGMRSGEILALEREDIRIINGKAYITVKKTVVPGKSGKRTTHAPKSGKHRQVVITTELADELLAPGRHPRRIFPARRNSHDLMNPGSLCDWFARLRKRAMGVHWKTGEPLPDHTGPRITGRPPRFHDLRHSHASNLLGAGVDMFVVSKRLGHSTITITVDIYGHLGKAADDAVLSAIALHRPGHLIGLPDYQTRVISKAA